ncbi:hypothetical protein CWC22_010110 [Pseudoalteromonas rubra]|uniref:Uncharacterized protein n=1 Tax=Pseudoalteromonas rubra TaxID=43658 RepID=A0A5S3UXW3_9GAMM|nr:hypothetical protein [Pseudoalteromonas rubra]QPB83325.1 hypothetical protein CWC22_010110 [Pseudoalteromonas rubra]
MQIFLALVILSISSASYADTLVTAEYEATVTRLCEDTDVVCDNVVLNLIHNFKGEKLRLGGKTRHKNCLSPDVECTFIGYEFEGKQLVYMLLPDGMFQIINQDG